MRKHLIILMIVTLGSCSEDTPAPALLETITSASVAFIHSGAEVEEYLQSPTLAYVSGYFYFEDNLAEDVVFGLDIEWMEGVDNPLHVSGGDWMCLVGLSRNGILWFPVGYPENRDGVPTNTDQWEIRNLNTTLSPNSWYRFTVIADFRLREFHAASLTDAQGQVTTIDLSGIPLEYPNYAPFDKPALTVYTFALRSQEFSPDNSGGSIVYFDDITAGFNRGLQYFEAFSNSFEGQSAIEDIPVASPVIPMENIAEDFWYFENENAKITITNEVARTGNRSIACNASLVIE